MRIIIMQDELYLYLKNVVKNYANSGIDPEEGLALYHLNQVVKNAQSVDDSQAAKVAISEDESKAMVSVVPAAADTDPQGIA